ncbi:MAG: glycosyltransferase family 2 protein [Acidimicrobiia bacterium]
MHPTISVVIPLFNGERHVTETLDSLAAQTSEIAEVIVVDDGSTDGGAAVARQHVLNPLVVSQPNSGVAAARNIGALRSSSEFVTFLDQDDLWAPQRYERLLAYLTAEPSTNALVTDVTSFSLSEDIDDLVANGDVLHRGGHVIDSGARAIALVTPPTEVVPHVQRWLSSAAVADAPPFITLTAVVRRETFFRVGGCPTLSAGIDDYLFLLGLAMTLGQIPLIDEPSVLYRVHPAANSQSADWDLSLLSAIIAYRLGRRPGVNAMEGSLRRNPFVLDHLERVAATDVRSAFALAELLSNGPGERWLARRRVARSAIRGRLRRRPAN